MTTSKRRERCNIQLAYPYDNAHMKGYFGLAIQPKLDGIRTTWDGLRLVSSTGLDITSVPHITNTLRELSLKTRCFLDGELYIHGEKFENISGASRSQLPTEFSRRLEFHVFDGIPPINGVTKFIHRLNSIAGLFNAFLDLTGPIKLVSTIFLDTDQREEEIQSALRLAIEHGYEGIILRNTIGVYEFKRTWNMMKLKPRKEDSYEILGYAEEISIEGEPKNALGAFVCGDERGFTFNVGSGSLLTRSAREELWAKKDQLIGKKLIVKYQELTTGRRVPRFPVAISIE